MEVGWVASAGGLCEGSEAESEESRLWVFVGSGSFAFSISSASDWFPCSAILASMVARSLAVPLFRH